MSSDEGSHESIERAEPFAVSPANRPRTHVTLLRWMILIAVVAICFAWVNSSIVAVVLVPVAFAAVVPRGTTWYAIETCAAVGWLLGAIVAFSELVPGVEFLLLFLLGVVLGISWSFRLIREVLGEGIRQNRLPRIITPSIGLIGFALLATNRDFEFRLWLSEPALRASASRVLADPPVASTRSDRWIGLIRSTGIQSDSGCVIWWTNGGFLDRVGLAYFPGPGSPNAIPGLSGYRIRRIRGPWWEVIDEF